MQREIKRNSVRQKNVIKSGSYRIILPDKSYLCQLSTINYQLMKYLYTALILAFLCQGGATAQEKKSGFFDKVKNTFSSEIKIGTYTFKDNGAVYTGEIKGRKPNGKGKTVFKNGDVYEGEYVKGKREGYGTYMFPDGEVSGGQKQRCACARALINEPKLILADEPTGALDSKASRLLLETMSEINKKMQATILMVTHDPFSASFCERILFLKDGKIFNEIFRGEKSRKDFFNEILDILTLLGGEVGNVR